MAEDPKSVVEAALRGALQKVAPAHADAAITLERPRQAGHGDFSSNLAMQLAKALGRKPRDLAQSLIDAMDALEGIERPEIAGPGFINFRLKAGARLDITLRFLREAAALVVPPGPVRVYDPVPNILTRRAGLERAQLLIQSSSRPALQEYLKTLTEELFEKAPRAVRWHLDVDPIEFD